MINSSLTAKSFNEVLDNETYEVRTTAGEPFTATDSAKLYAIMYKRFGYNLTATANAIARMLQSTY